MSVFQMKSLKNCQFTLFIKLSKKCSPKHINNNKLFDIIIKSLSKICVLFQDDRFDELYEIYSKSDEYTQLYFD